MHARTSKSYLAALALASGIILVAGYLMRPRQVIAPPISKGERIRLQNLAQRQNLERRTEMLTAYAEHVSGRVNRYLKDPASVPHREPQHGETLILVRAVDRKNETPQWITVQFAGYDNVLCDGQQVREMSMNVRISPVAREAVAFTLNEDVAGFVVPCGERFVVVAPEQFKSALQIAEEQRYMDCCGVRFAASGDNQPGRRVIELRSGSVLDRAGIAPGDTILTLNEQTVTSADLLRQAIAVPKLVVEVEQAGRKQTIVYEQKTPPAGASYQRVPEGTKVVSIEPGSRAELIGLRAGDIVIRAGSDSAPTPNVLEAAIAKVEGVSLVVLRGDRKVLLESRG